MPNRLAQETSPYLLQHADNPVDWYPWGDEALHAAREQNKPILLSIGYSTCHWCHVMAHESFDDPGTAELMNERFINIKVDREERPDLDKIYQSALQLINPQGGGWPLTMFLAPDTLLPFFGGTYFPPAPRYQLPGFRDLLFRVDEAFREQGDALREQGEKVQSTLAQMSIPTLPAEMQDTELLNLVRDQLAQQYDAQEGGFGNAPKFPMPNTLSRLLRHWAYTRRAGGTDKDGLDMVMISLTQMARGGLYDHLGGGFFRYATDRQWMVPHFEKMLYDNAQLLSLYAQALTLGPDILFEDALHQTVEWLNREMRHPDGGYYAALDADSEGEEGRFYVWRREQVKKLLDDDEYLLMETLYGLDKPANFENKWNLHRHDSWRSVVERLGLQPDIARPRLERARAKLFAAREERVRPARDDKLLVAWNGLLIAGLAEAGDLLQQEAWLDQAQGIADFIRSQAWQEGRLFATVQNGQARHPGYLDDYANTLLGLVTLLQARWRESDARFALDLADALLAHFQDSEEGGFYFTAHDHEQLIHRPKPTMDDALPPGNGTAALALARLGTLFGRGVYIDAAAQTLNWARALMERVPAAHCTLLTALEESVYPPDLVVLRGDEEEMAAWRAALPGGYQPWRMVFSIPLEGNTTLPDYLPRLTASNATVAYVCNGLSCSLPINTIEDLEAALK